MIATPHEQFTPIVSSLPTSDVLACAQVCVALRALCQTALQCYAIAECGTAITGKALVWLVKQRLDGQCQRIHLSDCEHITKAQISTAVAACPALIELTAVRVGPGSWSAKHVDKLVAASPKSLRHVTLDVLVEMKKDLHVGSSMLSALANPILRVEKLTLISDNINEARGPSAGAEATAADAAAAAAAATVAAVAISEDDNTDAVNGEDAAEAGAVGEQLDALIRLCAALTRPAVDADGSEGGRAPALLELDASSGALDLPGAASRLLVPLLTASGSGLRSLAACHLSGAGTRSLAGAVRQNSTLCTLSLNSNMIYGSTTTQLAASLEGHASLTRLHLDHNPILDAGGAAIAAILPSTRIADLSVAFTGVADGTCGALALALGVEGCSLRRLNLSGNRITTNGATSLAACLGKLHVLDLAANISLDAGAAIAVAKALPGSELRSLRLAGCKVDKKGCSRLAATLMHSRLTHLDLSANHFGSAGSDELAWVLADCTTLRTLSLADCNMEDDGADELLEAMVGGDGDNGDDASEPAKLRHLDLRWNKLGEKHRAGCGISAEPRVDASSQKQQTAAEKQTAHLEQTWQEAKAAGKKVYVPKWLREQQKKKGGSGGSSGTGSAMA